MKKLFVLFMSLAFFLPLMTIKANAQTYTTYTYARVESENVYLYKTNTSVSYENAYFALPSSYFVLLISSFDEYFYKAQYRDIVGYVLKDDVLPVAETPRQPYLENITFRVFASDGFEIYESPFDTQTPTIKARVENTSETIDYYGKIVGDEFVLDLGNIWYFCKKNNLVSGYLYAGFCNNLSQIVANTEQVTAVNEPFVDNDTGYLYNLIDMSVGLKITLICIVCIPSLILIYLLFKPFKLEKINARKLKSKTQTINRIQKVIDDEPL